MKRAGRWLLLALVVLIAGFFRLHRIDTVPPGLFIDEAQDALDAAVIERDHTLPVMVEAGVVKGRTREPMLHYLMAAMFALNGVSVRSIRLTVALIGIATVMVYFVLCERLFGTRIAALAGLLLAVSRWHVTMSRVGVRAVLTPLFVVLTLLALERLVRQRTLRAAVVFGVIVGFGFYTYIAYWSVPLALIAIGVWNLALRSKPRRRGNAALAGAALAACLLVMAPLLYYAATRPDFFFARSLRLSTPLREADAPEGLLLDQLQRALFELHLRGDPAPMYNIAGQPLLDPITGIAFLVGLFAVLKTMPRQPVVNLAVLIFWIVPLLPAMLAVPFGCAAMRSLGAAPAVFVISAFGLDSMVVRFGRRRIVPALLAAGLIAIAAWNYRDYFSVWANRDDVAGSYGVDVTRFFTVCADLADSSDVYLAPYIDKNPIFEFLRLEHGTRFHLLDSATALSGASLRDRVFVLGTAPLTEMIEALYPDHQIVARYSVWGQHGGVVLRVPAETLVPTLTSVQTSEAELWIGHMQSEFDSLTHDW